VSLNLKNEKPVNLIQIYLIHLHLQLKMSHWPMVSVFWARMMKHFRIDDILDSYKAIQTHRNPLGFVEMPFLHLQMLTL
jgi:hypothetical protein